MTKGLDTGTWTITDNADWVLPLEWVDEKTGLPIDMSGSTFAIHLKKDPAQAVPDLALATGSGITSVDLANGRISIQIEDEALLPGLYYGDIIQIDGGLRTHLIDLEVDIELGPTRP